ncbi:MAG: hypothetical protein LBR83_01365 [Clostridiales bacterium]|jgi:hypothetical protein|nr:hypothetical protein [Clostridiales bacterium]
MECTYQIPASKPVSPVAALRNAYAFPGPGDVIIGWNPAYPFYNEVLDIVHAEGKRCWLWLPVFSELPAEFAPVYSVGFNGKPQRGLSVMPGEDFRFACPSTPRNLNIAYEIYKRDFSRFPFDGVFLDKIRHASFAGGLTDGFGCFCASCREAYAIRGVDLHETVKLIRENPAAFLPDSTDGAGIYHCADPLAEKFFAAKADIITVAVAGLSARFQKRGLQVGLDVFAPLLAYFTGQDIPRLSKHAAFVKPMFYRITRAPAGLPFELDGMRESFLPCGADAAEILRRLWRSGDLCSAECMGAQLKSLISECPARQKFRPGFEIVHIPGICESNPAYIRETASLLENSGISDAVLCWDLLSAFNAPFALS